jgi:hypothetical protein
VEEVLFWDLRSCGILRNVESYKIADLTYTAEEARNLKSCFNRPPLKPFGLYQSFDKNFLHPKDVISLRLFPTKHCSLLRLIVRSGLGVPNFGTTRVTTREHPAAEGGTMGEKCPEILPGLDVPTFANTRVTTREHLVAEGGTIGKKCPKMLFKCRLPRYI